MRSLTLGALHFVSTFTAAFVIMFAVLVVVDAHLANGYDDDDRAYASYATCTTDTDCGCTDDCLEPLIVAESE